MKGHNLPKRLVRGKIDKSQEAKAPHISGSGGNIDTRLREINWTPAKIRIVLTVLLAPIVTAIVVSFNAGNLLIALVLIGLIIFVGLLYWTVRYIDRNEF